VTSPGAGVDLDPVAARAAGRQIHHAGEQLVTARQDAGCQIASATHARPWGADEMGVAFEKGGGDLLALAESVLDGWRRLGDRTAQLGTNIVAAADRIVAADESADARVGGIEI
jgi:hypothetical protein